MELKRVCTCRWSIYQYSLRLIATVLALFMGSSLSFAQIETEAELPLSMERAALHLLSIASANRDISKEQPVNSAPFSSIVWQRHITQLVGQQISQQLMNTLNRYGQAQVDISFDKNSGLRGRLDWLAPLYEDKTRLFFTQVGAGGQKNSVLLNLGLGQRHFLDKWMFGYHAFFDTDIKHKHLRGGFGIEAWRDYLKLGAHTYLPFSSWHSSLESGTLSAAKPARGYELSAIAYLPFYPGLGGRVKYERYFGHQIDGGRIHDPQLTFGIDYTPVPLLTFSLARRLGHAAFDETQIALKLTLDLDKPLRRQFDPGAVKAMRLLSGSRYDVVTRHNTITLEYRSDSVSALLPPTLIGVSQSNQPFNLTIQTKHPIVSVTWLGSAVHACGLAACASHANGQYLLKLPAYIVNGSNLYQLQAQVTDSQGNTFVSNSMVITVAPALLTAPALLVQPAADKTLIVSTAALPFMPVSIVGGTGPYVFSLGGPLPLGLSIDPQTGIISGQPQVVTPAAVYRVMVTDAKGVNVSTNFNLKIDPPVLVARAVQRNTTMVVGIGGQMFWPVRGMGGVPPYALTIFPALPVGLSKDNDGRVTGVPTAASPKTTYTVTVTDSLGMVATQTFYLTVVVLIP